MARCAAVLAIGTGLIAVPFGCAGKGGQSKYTRFPSGVKNRPKVEASAAEMYVTAAALEPEFGPGQSELNFFDELVMRDEVVNDDALHACMLLGTGVSLPTYDERVVVAQRLGWLRRKPARPPREAATVGEVSRIIVRMMGDKKRVTPARATERLVSMGLLPPEIHHYQGLSGAQLVSLLGQVEEALGPADLAAIRRSARENWYAQAVVDDGDGDVAPEAAAELPVVVEPKPEPSPEAAPADAAAQPQPDSPAPPPESTEPSPWRKGVPLRRPGN
jgi:hypothetical protein